ncbi:unnamed protein product [Lampetra fluviatilis]
MVPVQAKRLGAWPCRSARDADAAERRRPEAALASRVVFVPRWRRRRRELGGGAVSVPAYKRVAGAAERRFPRSVTAPPIPSADLWEGTHRYGLLAAGQTRRRAHTDGWAVIENPNRCGGGGGGVPIVHHAQSRRCSSPLNSS